ncbi:MAG: metalloregulator ArsR/SmtB family transcription factor [Deltaproteobacteria bacterium]|nr:metalloregulator ArsR/SmtB family transcription factor [Deltaproteobacteria bacterium]
MPSLDATHELFRLLGDPTRLRLLSVLRGRELTVAELTEITGAPQSRVSSHLAKLRSFGLLDVRREGAASFYQLDDEGLDERSKRHVLGWLDHDEDPLLASDREHARRIELSRGSGASWPDAVAGQMERHYSPGRTWEANARALIGLLRLGKVLDVASGDGVLAELAAPIADRITCLDVSERVVRLGRERLGHVPNVEFIRGDMHALPFRDAAYDQVLFVNALAYASQPDRAISEAARVLAPGGRLVGAALATHAHAAVVEPYGHLNLGFDPGALARTLESKGLVVELCAVTSRERRPPNFEVITLRARREPLERTVR